MERRQWERKLHKNSINFRNREEIGGRKYCQNQLLNRRRTIVEQTNGNSEWDLFSWSGIGISSAERTRVILLKFRRWSSQTQNRVQSRGERLIRVITQSSCVDMIQKKKKEKKGKRYNSFYFREIPTFPSNRFCLTTKRFVHFVEKSIKCSFVFQCTKRDKRVDAKSTLNSSSSF